MMNEQNVDVLLLTNLDEIACAYKYNRETIEESQNKAYCLIQLNTDSFYPFAC